MAKTNCGNGTSSSDNRGSTPLSNTKSSTVHLRPSMRGNDNLWVAPAVESGGSSSAPRESVWSKVQGGLLDTAVKGLTTPRVQSGGSSFHRELMSCIGVFTLHLTNVNRGFGTIGRKQTQLPDSEGDRSPGSPQEVMSAKG